MRQVKGIRQMEVAGSYRGADGRTTDLRAERGLADFDRTHVLVMNYNWELPFFARRGDWLGKTLGGWELAGINNFTSVSPSRPAFPWPGTRPEPEKPA